jgi:prepilin-type N-terminal cleavage/methylation domain-containing protein
MSAVRRTPGGFTLIEILVSMAILAIVLVSLYAAFHSGVFGVGRIEEKIGTSQAAKRIVERINTDLRNAIPFSSDDARFSGSQSALAFITIIDVFRQGRLSQEYAVVSYKLEGGKLLRTCRRGKESLTSATIEADEMADNVSRVHFKYGSTLEEQNVLQWKDAWDDSKKMPRAVRVEIVLGAKESEKYERTIYLSLAQVS